MDKKPSMLDKFVKYATTLGLDEKDLLSMTLEEAIEQVDKVREMWHDLIEDTK